jgi:DNA-binding CsgD family transcriptional regulator
MWAGVALREITLFLTLAEELHFGRTAERLQVTPSRVSQTLRELEAKLGGKLVHRTSRHVELTPRWATMPAIIAAFERRYPGCQVEMSRAPYGDAFTTLRRGEFRPACELAPSRPGRHSRRSD